MLRTGAFQTTLTLSSPPWCIPRHRPGSQRPSSGSLQRTDHLSLYALPASPRERTGRIDGKYKEDKFINIQNLYGTQLLSRLYANITLEERRVQGRKESWRKRVRKGGRQRDVGGRESGTDRGGTIKGRDEGVE